MTRPSRNMKRVSIFVPEPHIELVAKLAERKGVSPSVVYRAMLKKYLQQTIAKMQEEQA